MSKLMQNKSLLELVFELSDSSGKLKAWMAWYLEMRAMGSWYVCTKCIGTKQTYAEFEHYVFLSSGFSD